MFIRVGFTAFLALGVVCFFFARGILDRHYLVNSII